MPKFRRRRDIADVVEAVQFEFKLNGYLPEGVVGVYERSDDGLSAQYHYYVKTTNGNKVEVQPGDWIITERDGESHYPCSDAEFRARYEVISDKEVIMSEVKLKPFGDIVVLEPIEPDEKTAGGIILPDTAKEQRLCGRVVAAGPGKLREDGGRDPMDVEIGDVVYYQKYSGDPYQEGGKEYRMMHQTALFGKF